MSEQKTRVVINGIHAKSGGGVTYLRNVLPFFANNDKMEVHVFLHRNQYDLFYPLPDGIKVHLFDFNNNFWQAIIWEQTVLPFIVWLMGAQVTFSPANYGPIFTPSPVILLRNSLAVVGAETRFYGRLYWIGLAIMTWLSLMTCKSAIAVSEYARKSIAFGFGKIFKDKIKVIHHGVSRIFHPSSEKKENFVLAVADIYVQKNLHTLIDAIKLVLDHNHDIVLRIAGKEIDSEYASILRKKISELNIDNKIQFIGSLDCEHLNKMYNQCIIFVFPSTVETFGNPLAEAMACGSVIASSNTAAMPEILGNAGIYFSPLDSEDIAKQIIILLADAEKRNELSQAAIARSKVFSWESTANKTAEVLLKSASTKIRHAQ